MALIIEKDQRLDKIYKRFCLGTINNIVYSLEKNGLTKFTPEIGDYLVQEPLTESGFNLIYDAVVVGSIPIFERSKINILPYFHFNEEKVATSLVENAGLPIIRSSPEQNKIEVEFKGRQPLIKYINSYLDPSKNQATHIKQLETNHIFLVIESESHIN